VKNKQTYFPKQKKKQNKKTDYMQFYQGITLTQSNLKKRNNADKSVRTIFIYKYDFFSSLQWLGI